MLLPGRLSGKRSSATIAYSMQELKQLIREVPDFPKPGILFYDITTLLKNAQGLRRVIDGFHAQFGDQKIDVVVGIEARGYFFAPAIALALGTGFVPVRKPKKLPCEVEFWEYELEYGTDRLEIHKDSIEDGQRVLIVDDVLATGGTAAAVARLVEKLGGRIASFGFVIELDFLSGREKLKNYDVYSMLHYG
jgi:adenine phosphoribosyltransferase